MAGRGGRLTDCRRARAGCARSGEAVTLSTRQLGSTVTAPPRSRSPRPSSPPSQDRCRGIQMHLEWNYEDDG
jgi:hypothetical protein